MKRTFVAALAILASFALATPSYAAYFSGEDSNSLSTERQEDVFMAGNSISITAPIAGEVFAVGNTVTVSRPATRSVHAIGNTISVDQGAGYNAYVAGSNITLSGEYGHDVYAAGQNIVIKEGTVIKGDLRVAGATITINGTIDGSVYAGVDQLTFTGGKIGKDLQYYSDKDAAGLDKVTIGGKTEKKSPDARQGSAKEVGAFVGASVMASWFYKLLSALLIGAALILLLPKKVSEMSEIMNTQWSRAMGLGAIGLFITPPAILILFATMIGWKIGLALLLVYIAWLMIVPVYGLFLAGQWLLGRFGDKSPSPWAILLVGTVVVSLVTIVPVIGWLLSLVLFVILTLPALGASIIWAKNKIK